jgi:hypothetical protein
MGRERERGAVIKDIHPSLKCHVGKRGPVITGECWNHNVATDVVLTHDKCVRNICTTHQNKVDAVGVI